MRCKTQAWAVAAIALGLGGAASHADDSVDAEGGLFQRVVGADRLGEQRGGADIGVWNVMGLEANMDGNSARYSASGNNAVTAGAFTNASGLSTVIQNSGNNVIIQNATIINLDMR
jgi:hypothetical protein